MSKSSALRISDVRPIIRLIGDCRERGSDPAEWNERLAKCMNEKLGCVLTTGFTADLAATEKAPTVRELFADCWVEKSRRDYWLKFVTETGVRELLSVQRMFQGIRDRRTATRQDLIAGREWKTCTERNEDRRAGEQDELLISACRIENSPRFHILSLNRAIGERPFSERERRLVEFIHREIHDLLGTHLSLQKDGLLAQLTPRQRDVLDGLMMGDSEKQIAARLGLSKHTVHDYISSLYERFDLHSRAELIVFCMQKGWSRGEQMG